MKDYFIGICREVFYIEVFHKEVVSFFIPVLDVWWESSYVFLAAYVPKAADNTDQPTLVYVHVPVSSWLLPFPSVVSAPSRPFLLLHNMYAFLFILHPGGYKVSMLTHTYPHKPMRKIKVTICNHQTDSPLYVGPDVWSGDLQV